MNSLVTSSFQETFIEKLAMHFIIRLTRKFDRPNSLKVSKINPSKAYHKLSFSKSNFNSIILFPILQVLIVLMTSWTTITLSVIYLPGTKLHLLGAITFGKMILSLFTIALVIILHITLYRLIGLNWAKPPRLGTLGINIGCVSFTEKGRQPLTKKFFSKLSNWIFNHLLNPLVKANMKSIKPRCLERTHLMQALMNLITNKRLDQKN